MLQIDLKPSKLNKKVLLQEGSLSVFRDGRASSASLGSRKQLGLNSYNSLNRAVRIKDMAKIVEDNKIMLKKLQTASSIYNIDQWEKENK